MEICVMETIRNRRSVPWGWHPLKKELNQAGQLIHERGYTRERVLYRKYCLPTDSCPVTFNPIIFYTMRSFRWIWVSQDCKLMRLWVTNRIVDDSDLKPANFDHWFRSDSDFNDKIEVMIAIWIKFWYNFDYNRLISIFLLKSMDFDLFQSFFV